MKLNELVVKYQVTKDDEVFTEIYNEVSKHWRSLNHVAKSVKADVHELLEEYHSVLMKCVKEYDGRTNFINHYLTSLRNRRADIYRRKTSKKERSMVYAGNDPNDPVAATIENVADELTTEDVVLAKKKAEQRQLIDFLLSGENERTTAIVQAYLTTEHKTPTAIGNYLGLNHKQVTRVLNRLAAKFNTTDQFGKPEDWLVA